jgi:hypothetical protein
VILLRTSYPVPDLPTLDLAPGSVDPDPSLLAPEAPSEGRWWTSGRAVHVAFDADRGLEGVTFGSDPERRTPAPGAIRWEGAEIVRHEVSPRATRSHIASERGECTQTTWVPERLPGIVIELRPVSPETGEFGLRGRLELAPDGVGVGWDGDRTRLAIGHPGQTEPVYTLLAWGPDGPAPLFSEPRVEGARPIVTLDLAALGGAPVMLVALAGVPAPSTLRSLFALRAHARKALPTSDAPRVTTGRGDVDATLAWAWTRVRDRAIDTPDGSVLLPRLDPAAAADWVRTAAALGLDDAARAALADPPRVVAEADAWERWASAHGSDMLIEQLREALGPAGELDEPVRARLGDVAERAGESAWAAQLRTGSGSGGARRMTLPSLSATSGRTGPAFDVEAWEARLGEDPAALAPEGWRHLDGLVGGVLGYRPDVASGRLHFTPTLPRGWDHFAVESLRGGETRMRLEFLREEGGVERWRFAPVEGGVPSTLILRLPARQAPAMVRVDGAIAELQIAEYEEGVRLPVQIPLDAEREVEITPPSR